MSFSGDVKNSIIDSAPLGKCCRRALLLGIITARGQNEGKRISLTVDGDAVLEIAKRLVLECYGKEAEVTRRPRCRSGYFLKFTSSAAASSPLWQWCASFSRCVPGRQVLPSAWIRSK